MPTEQQLTQEDLFDLGTLTMNTAGVDEGVVEDQSNNFINDEGFYWFLVNGIKPHRNEAGRIYAVQVSMTCVSGCEPGEKSEKQVGRQLFHFINLQKKDGTSISSKVVGFNVRFAYGLGLVAKEDIGKPSLNIQWARALNSLVVVEVEKEEPNEYNKQKGRYRVSYGKSFQPTDPRMADIFRNQRVKDLIEPQASGVGQVASDVAF